MAPTTFGARASARYTSLARGIFGSLVAGWLLVHRSALELVEALVTPVKGPSIGRLAIGAPPRGRVLGVLHS